MNLVAAFWLEVSGATNERVLDPGKIKGRRRKKKKKRDDFTFDTNDKTHVHTSNCNITRFALHPRTKRIIE